MRIPAVLAALALAAGAAPAAKLTWTYDGYARLPAAAAEAKRAQKRILVGLAGSPT
ncbi:MAG: hypothetical protein ACYTDU_10340 [Planctomycetota bacterium]